MKGLLAVTALATAAVTSPAGLLTSDVPEGFELADGAVSDLTFEEYSPLSPEATAHVDPASVEATSMRAAVDVWTAGSDDILLREVTRWNTPEAARAFVEQAVVVGTENELEPAGSPFEGGVAFAGDNAGLRTRTLTWRQDRYAMTVSHFAARPSTDRVIEEAARALAASVEAGTGAELASTGVLPNSSGSGGATSSGDGIPITTVLMWVVITGVAFWLFQSVRRRRPGSSPNTRRPVRPGPPAGPPADNADTSEGNVDRPHARAVADIDATPDPLDGSTPTDDH